MNDNDKPSEKLWEKGWNGHEKAQLKRMAELPFREKIKWLEEAQQILVHISTSQENKRKNKN